MRWFKYEPAVPCRPHIYGEGIFVDAWKHCMREPVEFGDGEPNEKFAMMISPFDARAEDAVAASSFICWLGTNCGRSLLEAARRRFAVMEPSEAYVLTWHLHNRRMRGWNHHNRTIDAILPVDLITVRAVEIIEMTVWWLGTPDGAAMIKAANTEIELTQRAIRQRNSMEARAAERAANLT